MGDTSRDSGIEKLCESIQRMISQLMEQAQTKTSSTSEILKTLEPNPVRLTGPGDFFSWSRNATLILESHGLQKFLKDDEKNQLMSHKSNGIRIKSELSYGCWGRWRRLLGNKLKGFSLQLRCGQALRNSSQENRTRCKSVGFSMN